MDAALIAAGCLGLVAAGIHGVGGEVLVVRKLALEGLPRTNFGGRAMTKAMIHVSWHITTVAFFTVGCGLLLAGTVLDGDAAEAVALLAACASTGFAGVALGLAAVYMRSPRELRNHYGPVVLGAIAVLAWLGAI